MDTGSGFVHSVVRLIFGIQPTTQLNLKFYVNETGSMLFEIKFAEINIESVAGFPVI